MHFSTDTNERLLQLVEALARYVGILPPLPEDDPEPPMPTVVKSIGTSSRDYSTWTLHEADLDNGAIYAAGDTAQGEFYNDSAFDESVTINGGGTVGLSAIVYTAPIGQRHNGTAGTGARLTCSTNRAIVVSVVATIDWFEVHSNGFSGSSSTLQNNADGTVGRYLLIHDASRAAASVFGVTTAAAFNLLDSIIYDIANTSATGSQCHGVRIGAGAADGVNTQNCTVDRVAITNAASGGDAFCIRRASGVDVVQNCAACGASVAGSGSAASFSGTFTTIDHCLSSDATASGTGSLTNKAASNQFVSTVDGSEDYHLKAGADCIDAGTDLGTTPTGVNFDIDNRDRHALGDVWDIGADEFVSVGGQPLMRRWQAVPHMGGVRRFAQHGAR